MWSKTVRPTQLALCCFVQSPVIRSQLHCVTSLIKPAVSKRPVRLNARLPHKMAGLPDYEHMAAPVNSDARYQIPDGTKVWLYEVNAAGNDLPMEGCDEHLLPNLEDMVRKNNYTDVFIMCHGWNVEKDKKTNSIDFAQNLSRSLVANDPNRESHNILFIAVHWPSHPKTALYRSYNGSSDQKNYLELVRETNRLREKDPVQYWRTVKSALAKTDPKAAATLGDIADEIERSGSGSQLAQVTEDTADINDLPPGLIDKLNTLAVQLSPQVEQNDDKISPLDESDDPDMKRLVTDNSTPFLRGSDGPIAKPVSADVAHQAITFKEIYRVFSWLKTVLGFFNIGGGSVAAGAAVASRVLERIFFGQFQRRAAVVGAIGAHSLLSRLMKAADEKSDQTTKTKFHIIGLLFLAGCISVCAWIGLDPYTLRYNVTDSLGCHVASNAALGSKGNCQLPRKLNSLILLQGAVGQLEYELHGAYYSLSLGLQPVAGPVIATTSCNDLALENMEMFYGPVLGRQGFGQIGHSCDYRILHRNFQDPLTLDKNMFYTVQADAVINECTKFLDIDLDGAHGDLYDPELAHVIWQAAAVDVSEDDLVFNK